ncbi:MAG: hypothetical protein ACTSWM_02130 [Alphaproteobacteria bacterium]
MASTLITRLGGVAAKYLKPIAATAIALSPDGAKRYDVTTAPTITTGSGSPALTAAPNGSIYTDTGGTTAADTLYIRIGGSWVAIDGS